MTDNKSTVEAVLMDKSVIRHDNGISNTTIFAANGPIATTNDVVIPKPAELTTINGIVMEPNDEVIVNNPTVESWDDVISEETDNLKTMVEQMEACNTPTKRSGNKIGKLDKKVSKARAKKKLAKKQKRK